MNPSILSYIKYFHPDTDICVFKNGCNRHYKQYSIMYMFPLRVSTTHIPLPTFCHSLMLPVRSEFPWITTKNLTCLYMLAHIMSSSFTRAAKYCTSLILLLLIYYCSANAHHFLTTVQENKKVFVAPKLKEQMLPELYNTLLDYLPTRSLKAK